MPRVRRVLEPDVEIHTVSPDIGVSLARQGPCRPVPILLLPGRLQSRNRRGGESLGVGAEQRRESGAEVVRADAFEVQPRQQLLHRLGPPQIPRQDGRVEHLLRVRGPSIANPRFLDGDVAQPRLDSPFREIPVANHKLPPRLVSQVRSFAQVVRHFLFDRTGQQVPRSLAEDLRQHIPG